MGFSSPVDKQIEYLNRVRNQLLTAMECKKIVIEKAEEEITKLRNQITQEQDEIKQFSHSLSKDELQVRAKKILGLEKELERKWRNNCRLIEYYDLLNKNLKSLEDKINELELNRNNKDIIEVYILTMEEIDKMIKSEIPREGGFEIPVDRRTPDDVLKEILSDTKNDENGGFY